MQVTGLRFGHCLSLLVAITFCGHPALARTQAPRLPQRAHRLYYRDLVPKNVAFSEGTSHYSLTFKRQHRGKWEKQWSSRRYAEIDSRDPFRLEGTILAHDGRGRTSVLTDGRRVTPYRPIPVKVEGRVPRKGSKKRATDLPWVTSLRLDTDIPAIRRLAQSKGWVKNQRSWSEGDFQLDIGTVKLRYSTDGGRTWRQHTQRRAGDLVLHDVGPHDPIRYEATVPVRARSLGGRRFEGEETMVFRGTL
jgi:hypothetical protein